MNKDVLNKDVLNKDILNKNIMNKNVLNTPAPRVIVLGVDGVPYAELHHFIKQGTLPNLAKLFRNGLFHPLQTEVPPITAMGWPTIYTGKNPGKHGLCDFGPVNRQELKVTTFHNPRDCKAEFVWEILARNSIRCGVVGVPMSSPFRKKPAFGEGDHLREDWVNFDEWKNKDNYARVVHQNKDFAERIYRIMHNKFDQLEYAVTKKMDKERARFMALTVYAIDPLQHFRWHADRNGDHSHPGPHPGLVVEKGYRLIDERLGRLIKKLRRDDVLLIVSDHGMTQMEGIFHTNTWLEKHGFLVFKKKVQKKKKDALGEKTFLNAQTFEKLTMPVISLLIRTRAMRYMPQSMARLYNTLRKKVLPQKMRINESWETIAAQVDWSKTRAFSAGCVGNIFLNIKDREKHGIVDAKNAAQVCREIRAALIADLKKQGRACVVHRRDEIYHGPALADCPDLIPLIDGGKVLTTSAYPYDRQAIKIVDTAKDPQTATHDLFGIFGVYGAGVRRRMVERKEDEEEKILSVRDITPTILALFGLKHETGDMDGRVLSEFFARSGGAKPGGREDREAGSVFSGRGTEEHLEKHQAEKKKIRDLLGDIQF